MSYYNRRKFLTMMGGVAVSGCATSPLNSMMNENANSMQLSDYHGKIIGHGDFQYKVNNRWGLLNTQQTPVKNCHAMVMNKQKQLMLLTDHKANNIIVYDQAGKLMASWTLNLNGAHGLTINQEGEEEFLYIACYISGRVIKTDIHGKVILELPSPHKIGAYKPWEQYKPTETAVAPNGDIYVADGYGSQYISQYNQAGEFIRRFGGKSVREGYFHQAHGITLDTRDPNNLQLICTARIKNAYKFFSLDGKYLRTLHLPGALVNRAVIDDGNIYTGVCFSGKKPYAIERNTGFVMVIDKNEKVVSNPGGTSPTYINGEIQRMYQSAPIFKHPHDVCIDQDKNLYIPQWNANNTYPIMLERV